MQKKTYTMDDEPFWDAVECIGWGTKTTDYDAVKVLLMKRGPVWCQAFASVHQDMYRKLDSAAQREGHDICMDSWSDTMNHTIGLGQQEYEACLREPEKLIDRHRKLDYVESFSYCIPQPCDFADRNPGVLAAKRVALASEYREGLGRVPEADKDIRKLLALLEADDFAQFDAARGLAAVIEETCRRAVVHAAGQHARVVFDGGDPLVNKWACWNFLSKLESVANRQGE